MKHALLATALLLAACGPVYRTNYNLFPPESASGQMCVKNVSLMSDTCVANCRQMSRSCASPGGFSTSVGFGSGHYGRGMGYGVGYGSGYNNAFDDRDCSPTQCIESCLATGRQAHLNCGGTIQKDVVCTANCPKPQTP
ncbi:MAG: hypothetical protein EON60_02015 [Alphaproteobacteria bacterium]|nr:MAG: hypothetical protein EON60_02015 [Alphaproteobacteria bacterium]